VDSQHYLAENVALRETAVGFCGIDQVEGFRDRDLELRGLDGPVEPLEFADPGYRVIGDELDAAPFLRLGLNSIRISQAAVAPQRVERALERVAADQCKYGVDAGWREASRRFGDVLMLAIDRDVGTHLAHEFDAFQPGTGCKHARAAQLGELDSQSTDPARAAVNDDALAFFEVKRAVDALQRRKARGRDRAGVLEIEPFGDVGDLFGRNGDVLKSAKRAASAAVIASRLSVSCCRIQPVDHSFCQYKTAGESASQSPNVSGDDRSVLTELVDLAGTLYLGSLLNNCCATLITSSFL
jgi:hypothetical protein